MAALKNLSQFSVLLLSAGSGTRLGSKGKKTPKSLLRINSTTILSRLVSQLISNGLKEINIVVVYKYKKILKELSKFDSLKVNYIRIKDYVKNGSAFSWFKFKNLWNKKKKPLIIMHTDIILDKRYIENIIKSRSSNIIGVKKQSRIKLKKKSFVAQVNNKMKINAIGLNQIIKKNYGEIICVNKFSVKVANKIFKFMKKYFKINGSNMTWEFIINDFIKYNNVDKIYTIKNQVYKWVNVNTAKDLALAKKIFNN